MSENERYEDEDIVINVRETSDDDNETIVINQRRGKRRFWRRLKWALPIICVAAFLTMGFFIPNAWGKAWIVFLLIPFYNVIYYSFIIPRRGKAVVIASFIAITLYLGGCLFCTFGPWHYDGCWWKFSVIFFIIPIVAIFSRPWIKIN